YCVVIQESDSHRAPIMRDEENFRIVVHSAALGDVAEVIGGPATVHVTGKDFREARVIVAGLAARLGGMDSKSGGIKIALRTNAGSFDKGAILRGFFDGGQFVQRTRATQVRQVNVEITGSIRKQARGLRRSCSPQQPAKR